MKKSIYTFALACLLGVGAAAQADTISFSASHAVDTTDWNDVLNLGKFDSSLGTLTGIRFDLSGVVYTTGNVESLDDSISHANLSLNSTISLSRPNNSAITSADAAFSHSVTLAAFDGDIDFAGTSGATTGLHTSNLTSSFVSHDANDFALFSANHGVREARSRSVERNTWDFTVPTRQPMMAAVSSSESPCT